METVRGDDGGGGAAKDGFGGGDARRESDVRDVGSPGRREESALEIVEIERAIGSRHGFEDDARVRGVEGVVVQASSHTLSHRGSESVACEGENCKKRSNAENKPVIFGSAAASPAPAPPSSSTEHADACAPAFLRPVVRSNPCFSAATPVYARTSS